MSPGPVKLQLGGIERKWTIVLLVIINLILNYYLFWGSVRFSVKIVIQAESRQ